MGGSLYNKIPLGRRKVVLRAWRLGACLGGVVLVGITMFLVLGTK